MSIESIVTFWTDWNLKPKIHVVIDSPSAQCCIEPFMGDFEALKRIRNMANACASIGEYYNEFCANQHTQITTCDMLANKHTHLIPPLSIYTSSMCTHHIHIFEIIKFVANKKAEKNNCHELKHYDTEYKHAVQPWKMCFFLMESIFSLRPIWIRDGAQTRQCDYVNIGGDSVWVAKNIRKIFANIRTMYKRSTIAHTFWFKNWTFCLRMQWKQTNAHTHMLTYC